MQLRDIDIRNTLRKRISNKYQNDSDTLIVDELGLCQGTSRIDIAVINGYMYGYEIKSEKDTLERLPLQIEIYNKIFDEVILVTCDNHIQQVMNLIPEWWGILLVRKTTNNLIEFTEFRSPKNNPLVDLFSIAQLLWRDEGIDILKEKGLVKGIMSKPRLEVWERLVEKLDPNDLKKTVRDHIKIRANWRSD
jgi:hypothetical protein